MPEEQRIITHYDNCHCPACNEKIVFDLEEFNWGFFQEELLMICPFCKWTWIYLEQNIWN